MTDCRARNAPWCVKQQHTFSSRRRLLFSQLLTASADGTLCIWDVESGTLTRSVAIGQPVAGLAVPPGGNVAHLSVAWSERGAGRVSVIARRHSYCEQLYEIAADALQNILGRHQALL